MSIYTTSANWQNALTGAGGVGDKGAAWRYVITPDLVRLCYEKWAAAYTHDDVVAAVVDRVPDEMFGRGLEVVRTEDGTEDEAPVDEAVDRAMKAELKTPDGRERLSLVEAVDRAARWERLFGGGAVLPGFDDGRPLTEPLDPRAVKSLRWVQVLDPRELFQQAGSPNLWRAQFYEGSFLVHRSRLVVFSGHDLPCREARVRQGWGAGAVERAWTEIVRFHGAWAGFSTVLTEPQLKKFKLRNLITALSEVGPDVVLERMRFLAQTLGPHNLVLLDAATGEDVDVVSSTLQGFAEPLRVTFERLAMAVGIPVTVLVGISPAGLNATGESDLRLWYDRVAALRARDPQSALVRLAQLVAPLVGSSPDDLAIRWPPFWRQTDDERSATRKADADADAAEFANLTAAADQGWITELEARSQWRRTQGLSTFEDLADPTGLGAPGEGQLPGIAAATPVQFTTSPNNWVGSIGERVQIDALVTSAGITKSDAVTGQATVRYLLDVPQGTLVWTAVGERPTLVVGQSVRVSARIIEHEDVAGLKLTRIQRPVFTSISD